MLKSSSCLCISPTLHPSASDPGRLLGDASPSRLCCLVGELPGSPLTDPSPLCLCSLVDELPGCPLADASPSHLCSLDGELPGHPLAGASPLCLYSMVILCSLVALLCHLIVAP
ncbi:hypothetical protein Syun_020902 [Stephania yunnanensis]|uniref:Uncharacterized protein n=1 Tax=Stephania yunnanensis TaxID=152371 RepID=A0AAP0IFB3_9MAGN